MTRSASYSLGSCPLASVIAFPHMTNVLSARLPHYKNNRFFWATKQADIKITVIFEMITILKIGQNYLKTENLVEIQKLDVTLDC